MNAELELARNIQGTKRKLWNIHYINTLAVNLIINISAIILINLLPLYTISIGGNNFFAGILMTILTLSAFIFRPFFGRMIDEKGRRKVLILGLCLFSAATLALVIAVNIPILLILRFIQGIGLSAYSTALGTIISDVVPNNRISEGIGYFGIAGTIAMAVGPPLGLFLCDMFGYQLTYVVTFGITVVSIIVAYFINYEEKWYNKTERKNEDNKQIIKEVSDKKQNQSKGNFIEKSAIKPCIVSFFIVFAISSVFSFMPIFGKERNIDNVGMFFTVYAVSVILIRLFTGKMADLLGYRKVFLPAIIITLMLFITLIFANSLPAVLLAAIFYGVGYGTIQPIMNTMVIKFSPMERRGAANATFYATMDIGFGLGSFVWGLISQVGNFTIVFMCCALCIIISVIVYFLILHARLKEIE